MIYKYIKHKSPTFTYNMERYDGEKGFNGARDNDWFI